MKTAMGDKHYLRYLPSTRKVTSLDQEVTTWTENTKQKAILGLNGPALAIL